MVIPAGGGGVAAVYESTRMPLPVIQPVLPVASSATKPTSILSALTATFTASQRFGVPETGARSTNCQGPPFVKNARTRITPAVALSVTVAKIVALCDATKAPVCPNTGLV